MSLRLRYRAINNIRGIFDGHDCSLRGCVYTDVQWRKLLPCGVPALRSGDI